mmetsp:Transcript_77778/g.175862  ORF Transcript_77778/g.175862 Transcript_77778/m.175862 type:complete len:161 (+) Transcript_77778:81-563(+)
MPVDPEVKQLGIKVGPVRRTKKEYEMYLKEETKQKAKIEKMKADGVEEADVKKQIEVLNDTLTVIPDTRQRLQKYCSELREFLSVNFQDVEALQPGSGGPPSEEDKAPAGGPDAQVRELVLEGRQLLGGVAEMLGLSEDKAADPPAGGTGGTGDCCDDDV